MVNNTTDRFNGYVASLGVKAPCIVATNAAITLSGLQTVNSVAVVSGDRVLVKDQTNAVENGIYEVRDSGWERTPDFDGNRDVTLDTVVFAGVSGADPIMYRVTGVDPFKIGTSQITWAVYLDPSSLAGNLQEVTDVGNLTTNSIRQTEQAAAPDASVATAGQYWVRNDAPNVAIFTDDDGNDINLTAELWDNGTLNAWADPFGLRVRDTLYVGDPNGGVIKVNEQAAADADEPGYGQFWTRDDAPGQSPMWTGDDGVDYVLNAGGGAAATTFVINADINTATPPASEAVTAQLIYRDLADDDDLAMLGFSATNDLELRNYMADGDIVFYQDNNVGTATEQGRFVGGASGGVDGWFQADRIAIVNQRTQSGSQDQPQLQIGGAKDDGNTSPILAFWPNYIQKYGNDFASVGTLAINADGGAVSLGAQTGALGAGGVAIWMDGKVMINANILQTSVFFPNPSSLVPSGGSVGGDMALELSTSNNSPIARFGIRASDDVAYIGHDIHGADFVIEGQNSIGSDRISARFNGETGVELNIPNSSTIAAMRTATVVNGLVEINTDGAGAWAPVLTSLDVGGASNTNWSTGGGSTYSTGATSALESGAVQTFESGAILEIEESATMADPAAGFGRVWVRDAVPNVLAFTDDAGDDFDLETTIKKTESVTATNVITAIESGTTFYLNAVGGFTSTLPAPAAGLHFTFIVATAPTTAYIITTNAGANILEGTFLDIVGELQAISAQDTLNFVASTALVGDRLEVESDGTSWFCTAFSKADGGITVSVT